MNGSAIRIVFFGSPEFAVPSLQALLEAGYDVAAVVTQPDKPAGRGGRLTPPPVKDAALAAGVDTVLQPETLRRPEVVEELRALEPDVFVIAAYGKLLPPAVLAVPRRGSVNVHASLLPRWRGAAPVAAAILAGDRETGVTIMEVTEAMDAGPIVAQRREPVRPDDTTGTLERRLAALGAELLLEALPGWYTGELVPVPQDETLATYCRPLKKEDGHLRSSMTAEEAERAVRAFDPWPGAFVLYKGQPLRIWRARALPGSEGPPGRLLVVERAPAIVFREGILVLDEVQRPGGRRISGRDFVNGERGALAAEVTLADG